MIHSITLFIVLIFIIYRKKNIEVTINDKVLLCKGAGFCGFWYSLGMASVLENKMDKIIGYSSGAIVAALVCSLQSSLCFDTIMLRALETKQQVGVKIGKFHRIIEHFLDMLLPEDAHIRCSGKCSIILCDPTKLFYSKIINSWDSRKDLINCIVASTYIPFLVGNNIVDPNYSCIDGASCIDLKSISNNVLSTHNNNFTNNISEIYFPISAGKALKYFEDGIKDGNARLCRVV